MINNQLEQSRESFEDNILQTKELNIKRQQIEELRKKFNILIEENRYLKGDMGGSNG